MKSSQAVLASLIMVSWAFRADGGIILTDQWRLVRSMANASRCGSDQIRRESSDPGEFSETALAQRACEDGSTTATIVQRSYIGTDGLRAESVSSSVATPTQQTHFRYYYGSSVYSVNFEIDVPESYRIVMRAYALLSLPNYPNSYVDDPFAFIEMTRNDQPYLGVISYWNGSPEAVLNEIAAQVVLQPGRYSLYAASRLTSDLYFAAPGLMQSAV